MNKISKINNKLAALLCGVAVALAAGLPAVADDTEILVGAELPAGQPNVLFLLDTSGSMNSEVVVGVDYDPDVTYAGNCDVDRLYWSLEGAGVIGLPDCTQGTWINREAMKCSAAVSLLATQGRFRDRYAQWDTTVEPNFWNVVAFQNAGAPPLFGRDRLTECRTDFGRHGDGVGDEFFPTNGENGPWGNSQELAIDWDDTGNSYTFYDGNYLNWIQETGEDTVISTRMEELKRVMSDVLTDLTGVNTGLMRFSTNSQGGMVLHELARIEDNVDTLLSSVASLTPNGGTPLAETLYEATLYYGGHPVDFGLQSTGDDSTPLPSVAASRNGDNYRSPITLECQRNYVILLTDGFPAGDADAQARIEMLDGFPGCDGGSCLDELSAYMATVDQRPVGLAQSQTIETFTIGFHTEQKLLLDTATGQVPLRDDAGNILYDENNEPITRPGYFTANDQTELTTAFDDIFATIQTEGETFTAPALSINLQNRLTNREDVYLAVFQPPPRGEPHWEGNIKKYRIGRPGGAGADSTPTIIDAKSPPEAAVDDNGLIKSAARSYWSDGADGGVVTDGGFVNTLTANRDVYTNLSGIDLTSQSNRVIESNDDLTAALLGTTEGRRDTVIKWARGVDSDGDVRASIGDPLHSEPTLLAYSENRFTLFFGTNDGFLHAIDPEPTTSGVTDLERFAFIPRELLGRLDRLARNDPNPADRDRSQAGYGLDGPMRIWVDETTRNGVVDSGSGDRAYLYVGMRRGGRNYYALDVTNIESPQLKWTIRGGTGDFAELGQTWSAPVVSKIKLAGQTKQVLIFAGGNDDNQDARNRPAGDDDMGRAIFIVDALTGQRLWWASIRDDADLTLDDMTHSIPSDLRVVDTNQDGFDDRIYVGDTKAQMWRFDIDDSGTITGGVFASLGGDDELGNRKIYYPPSVTRVIDETGTFLTLSFGTGHRAHPLETGVEDAFFMLRDANPFTPPVDSNGNVDYLAPITLDRLLDITENADVTVNDLANRPGWFIQFEPGEKNISAPLAVLNQVFFTTYLPSSPQPSCEPTQIVGAGRLYVVDILTGRPINYFDQPSPDDRYQPLPQGGLPPTPSLVFTTPPCDDCDPSKQPVSEITLLQGTQSLPSGISNVPVRTYWVQEDIDR